MKRLRDDTSRSNQRARWITGTLIGLGLSLLTLAPSPLVAGTLAEIFGTPYYLPVVMLEATLTPTNTATPTTTRTPTHTPSPTATRTPVPSGLARNGGFETADNSTGSGTAFWAPWWAEIPKPCPSGCFDYAFKPNSFNRECLSSGAASIFIFSGDCSLRVLNNWDPWWGGVYETVSVPPGQRLRLSAYGRAWTSSQAYPAPSDSTVSVEMRVGIEPNGSCNAFSGSVVWSGIIVPHNTWQQASVEANAGSGGTVCLFLSTDYRGDSRFNMASFWDGVNLSTVS